MRPQSGHSSGSIGGSNYFEEEKGLSQNMYRMDMRESRDRIGERITGGDRLIGGERLSGGDRMENRLDSSFEINLSRDREGHEPRLNNYLGGNNNSRTLSSNTSGRQQGVNYEQSKKMLDDLKKTRADLRDKLHTYQVNFTKNNNRRIKYHKDIVPVENEYKRYKEIKQEISRLESLLGLKQSNDSH